MSRGIAPGADAWHAYARNMRANFWEIFRQRERADAEAARLRAENAQMRAAIETQGREHWYPCGYGPLCPWCEADRWREEAVREGAAKFAAEREVERLNTQPDAARAAWAVALGFAHGGIDQDVCLFCADVQAVTDALGGDDEVAS